MIMLHHDRLCSITDQQISHVNVLHLIDFTFIGNTNWLVLGGAMAWEICTSVIMVCVSDILAKGYYFGHIIL